MRRFVLGWKIFGLGRTLGSRLVNYADDLVILCKRGTAELAMHRLREIIQAETGGERREDAHLPSTGGEFDFLGYTFGRVSSARPASPYRLPASKRSIKRVIEKVHALDRPSGHTQDDQKAGGQSEPHVARMGELLPIGPSPRRTKRSRLTGDRLRQWLRRKHRVRRCKGGTTPTRTSTKTSGWYVCPGLGTTCRGRRHEGLSESRMREICTSGSMRGVWKRSYG